MWSICNVPILTSPLSNKWTRKLHYSSLPCALLLSLALSLTIIFLLGLVILMGYAVVAFSIFNTYFHAPSQGLFCDTLFACFVTVVRLGALANPPLGDVSSCDEILHLHGICHLVYLTNTLCVRLYHFLCVLQNITISGKFIALSLFRLAYGISFFIVVTTLGLNVVIAILVDNFSALRQTKVNKQRSFWLIVSHCPLLCAVTFTEWGGTRQAKCLLYLWPHKEWSGPQNKNGDLLKL